MDGLVNILVSGFTQRSGRCSGMFRLHETLVETGFCCCPRWRTYLLDWRADWADVADRVNLAAVVQGLRPRINLVGYSYGGWGALQLAQELGVRGIEVPVLTLVDPVARWKWVPRPIPNLSSMLPRYWSRLLYVPGNVGMVHEFYQRRNLPQGHRLVLDPATRIGSSTELDLRHDQMDDAAPVHHCVLDAATGLKTVCTAHERHQT